MQKVSGSDARTRSDAKARRSSDPARAEKDTDGAAPRRSVWDVGNDARRGAAPVLMRLDGAGRARAVARLNRLQGNRAVQRTVAGTRSTARLPGSRSTPQVHRRVPPFRIQRGEAGVHHDIEMEALGVSNEEPANPDQVGDEERAAMEVYAGNWMRDFSQFFVPAVVTRVSEVPQRPGDPESAAIGVEGTEPLLTGLLRAIASLEFDPSIVDTLITEENLGYYRPEEHMDNPAGMSLSGDVLVESPAGAPVPASTQTESALQGSAGLGPQVENPRLYEISGHGLASHIYNTTEWVKEQFIDSYRAVERGNLPQARQKLGSGMHGIEDYFAHSNFIEVALNLVLQEQPAMAPPDVGLQPLSDQPGATPVDTLFDARQGDRQAVTTGTFTSTDTAVSLAHVLLPRLPMLFSRIDRAIDRTLQGLQRKGSTWDAIQKQLQSDASGRALLYLLQGMDQSGMQLQTFSISTWSVPDLPAILPDEIEGLEGLMIPTQVEPQWLRPSAAMASYQRLYEVGESFWQHRESLRQTLSAVLTFVEEYGLERVVGAMVVRRLRQAVAVLAQPLSALLDRFAAQLRQQVRARLIATVEQLLGIDISEEKRQMLEEGLAHPHELVEHLVHGSSLEVLRQPGGALADLSPGDTTRRIPRGALPPSHSEISKDHPPLAAHGGTEDLSVHGPSPASAFYALHRRLAVEADRHLTHLMELAWQAVDASAQVVSGRSQEMDEAGAEVRNREARGVSERSQALAEAEGRVFAQAGRVPEPLAPVLDAVDLYISHPDESGWWRAIVQTYIHSTPGAHVADQIRRRNAMRRARGAH